MAWQPCRVCSDGVFRRRKALAGAIYRTIPLPPGVDGEKAQASFKNGVLTIKLPQTPEAQAKIKRIDVKNG